MNLASPFSISVVAITVLAFLGLPIGHSMIAGSIVYLWLAGLDMGTAAEQLLNGLYTSYLLLAVPMFILAAEIMNAGSMTDRLLQFCNAVVGRFRGGLAQVNVLQSIIFAGMSGSAIADAAGTGKMMQQLMTKDGKYPASYAAALTAVTSVVGPIIPPSIPLVIYALISDASIGFLFIAGIVPGLLLGAVADGDRRGRRPPQEFPGREAGAAARDSRDHVAGVSGAHAAGRPARRHPRRRDDADRGGGRCRRLCAAHLGRHLPQRFARRALPRAFEQRPHHRLDRHAAWPVQWSSTTS